MDHKKKYYIFSLVLLFGMLFVKFSTCYADSSELTPINNLDTDMVNLMIEYLKDNNSYNYINSTCANNFNSFYNSKTDEAIQNFCNKWNSIDFSNYVETLEQCVFIIDTYNNLPMISVYFNNNGLGNKALHYQLSYYANSYNSFYRNDNGNTITNKRLSFYFNSSGTISYDGLYDVGATNGRTINLNAPTLTMIDNTNFESKVMFSFYEQSIYFRNNSSAFNWLFLNGNSILEIKKEEPEEPINGATGTITNPSGEVTGNIDLTGIEQGIGNIQNQISGDTQKVINNQNENTDKIIQNQNQNTQSITNSLDNIGNFLNEENEKESGEIAEALDVGIEVEDPTADFFTWFFEQLKQCFTISTAQYLHFSILENEFTINSDDYIINIPILKNVLGIGSGIFILYGIFKDLRRELEKVKEGKFEEIANEDITANMM